MINWVVTLISPLSQRRRVQKRLRRLDKTELYVLATLNTIHKVLEEDLNIKIL
jgi:cell division protein ZapA (FtsZ GTPase activity inhibitor)